jgi:hypothetical protein
VPKVTKVLSIGLSGAVPKVSVAGGRISVGLCASKGAAPVMVGGPKLAPFSPKTWPGAPPAKEALEDAPRVDRLPWVLSVRLASLTAAA